MAHAHLSENVNPLMFRSKTCHALLRKSDDFYVQNFFLGTATKVIKFYRIFLSKKKNQNQVIKIKCGKSQMFNGPSLR